MEKFPRAKNRETLSDDIPPEELADMESSPVNAEEMAAELKNMQEAVVEAGDQESEEGLDDMKARQEQEDEERLKSLRAELGLKSEEEIKADEDRIHKIMMDAMSGDGTKGPEKPEDAARAEKEPNQTPPEKPPENDDDGDHENGEDDDEENEGGAGAVVLHERQTETKHKMCERCGGTGRRFFFFNCSMCHGSGRVVESQKTSYKDKIVGQKAAREKSSVRDSAKDFIQGS